eukprot:CAMPEP_0116141792 /NCGR_PEP_ID=MMETSP0329-20121206/14565_1 /TAXON_ID=697910 /ORGANISM="Pseudo-nitzschia arenysensis, Strain B593" /LENGTH=205 /DNA_ID=CAMNT_0003636987 /DNA_START=21 /DNA_END=638 /DNA_ORIENTATION=-
MILRLSHRLSGRKTVLVSAPSKVISAVGMFFAASLLLLLSSQCPMVAGLSLNPSTPPGDIIERQLEALKDGDIGTVYKFASPGNKQQTGDVTNFARMVQSGPYRFLLGHINSEILLESKMAESRQYLVRVTSSSALETAPSELENDNEDDDDNEDDEEEEEDESLSSQTAAEQKKVLEYWWSLSRCKTGEYSGSYMVDAVIPNQM